MFLNYFNVLSFDCQVQCNLEVIDSFQQDVLSRRIHKSWGGRHNITPIPRYAAKHIVQRIRNMHPEKYKYVYWTRLEAANPFINLNRMAP